MSAGSRTKVLHVFGRMQRQGAQLRTLAAMERLDQGRYEFHYCADEGVTGELDEEIRRRGGQVHLIRMGAAFPLRFWELNRRLHVDVVHSHVHHSSGRVLAVAAAGGVPVRIAHFRSTDDGRGSGPVRRLYRSSMRALIDRYATQILAVSKSAMELSWSDGWEADVRCRVVYNGLDPALCDGAIERSEVLEEFDLPPGTRLYLHVGRMTRAKNHLRLIRIFERIARNDASARLLLAGHGGNQLEAATRELANRLGLEDKVVFAGPRSDALRLLKAADVLVFPSLWEGLAGAVLEACAVGTPVLASDLASIREIAVHFPTVELLSLEERDSTWAERAVRAAGRPRDTKAGQRLRQSPFLSVEAARVFEEIYSTAATRAEGSVLA